MAKRQIRITGNIIASKWPEISGKKANIVFGNGIVLMALLTDLDGMRMTIENIRLKKQVIDTSEISEIIIDY